MAGKRSALAALAVLAASAPAHAAVTLSSATTANMNCSGGACVPTAPNAVLNTTDLETDLSQFGNVHVMTTGSGVEANNIEVRAPFTSPDSTSLTLEAHKAITVNAAVSIGAGTAELELQSDTLAASDTLSFGRKGHITFGSLSDIFGINGGLFTLVDSVQGLASAIATNPSGSFAFARDYDASVDGTYTKAPIKELTGAIEGLGNTVSNLSVESAYSPTGLIGTLYVGGEIDNFHLKAAAVIQDKGADFSACFCVGGLIGNLYGSLKNVSVSGALRGYGGQYGGSVGGVVGWNGGSISNSFSNARVRASGKYATVGGLAGGNKAGSLITNSYATGSVYLRGSRQSYAGGLVGRNEDQEGGLFGIVSTSYSTGAVRVPERYGNYGGGLIGYSDGGVTAGYWDTTTSGTETGVGYGSDSGVTGLTTEQLQSGLPTGFDPKVWAESPNINNGLPYLIANPPPK